jgi:ABC-type Zn uptake system ZnuABC Zn-binding protein ZnuA
MLRPFTHFLFGFYMGYFLLMWTNWFPFMQSSPKTKYIFPLSAKKLNVVTTFSYLIDFLKIVGPVGPRGQNFIGFGISVVPTVHLTFQFRVG